MGMSLYYGWIEQRKYALYGWWDIYHGGIHDWPYKISVVVLASTLLISLSVQRGLLMFNVNCAVLFGNNGLAIVYGVESMKHGMDNSHLCSIIANH